MNKTKHDDRSDNESKIKRAMSNTQSQMQAAKEVISTTSDPKTKPASFAHIIALCACDFDGIAFTVPLNGDGFIIIFINVIITDYLRLVNTKSGVRISQPPASVYPYPQY